MKLQIFRLDGIHVLKSSINRLLRPLGLQLVRLGKTKKIKFPPSPAERREVDGILRDFVNQNSYDNADLQKWRQYLSDARISLFHEIMELVSDREICCEKIRVADFGSGTGYLLRLVARAEPSAHLSGFDTLAKANNLARNLCPSAEIYESWPSADAQKYDLIFCTEVLEHMVDPAKQLAELAAAVTPGGWLVLTVPNGRTNTQSAGNLREDGTAYWGHVHFWSPESWPLFLSEALPDDAEISTGILPSGMNFGVARLSGGYDRHPQANEEIA